MQRERPVFDEEIKVIAGPFRSAFIPGTVIIVLEKRRLTVLHST